MCSLIFVIPTATPTAILHTVIQPRPVKSIESIRLLSINCTNDKRFDSVAALIIPWPITPTWYCSRLTPSIQPDAVSPDLINLWLDSMFISPLELSWEIRWCTTATQSLVELSRKVQLTQRPAGVDWMEYVRGEDGCSSVLSVSNTHQYTLKIMVHEVQHKFD